MIVYEQWLFSVDCSIYFACCVMLKQLSVTVVHNLAVGLVREIGNWDNDKDSVIRILYMPMNTFFLD